MMREVANDVGVIRVPGAYFIPEEKPVAVADDLL
jgi:hypothetical protein